MSGTSLDGLDLAFCRFDYDGKWSFQLIAAETVAYDAAMRNFLLTTYETSGEELAKRHVEYGHTLGKWAFAFLKKHNLQADYISSHGHTIFHQPSKGFTFQLGSGQAISAETNLPVIYDFRSKDVALGGQGAPLVPIGDRLLFSAYNYCLNLGGIANISFEENGRRIAYDICPCNLVLNYLAEKENLRYDKNGDHARSGKVNEELFHRLNEWSFYKKSFPKSLGREDIDREIIPLLEAAKLSTADLSATFCKHIAHQISQCSNKENTKMLITGGGAFHTYLVNEIRAASKNVEIVIPETNIINFKEAIIFAFLGTLRVMNQINTLASVTGAREDSVGGVLVTSR